MFLSESGPETLEILSAEIVQNHVASELFLVPVTDIARYRKLSTEDTLQDGKRQRMCLIAKILDIDKSALADPSEIIPQLSRILDIRSDCS